MLERVICLVVGYAFGCLLTAEIVCRKVAHTSSFDLGVGNPGMANVAHELGSRWGLVTLGGDIAKTLVALVVCAAIVPGLGWQTSSLWAALGTTLGHTFPVWHRFKGGKGVATTCAGIVLATPLAGLVSVVAGGVVVLTSGYLCIGAIAISGIYLVFSIFSGSTDQAVVAVALLALMLRAHLPAVMGIRTGETGKTSLLDKLKH